MALDYTENKFRLIVAGVVLAISAASIYQYVWGAEPAFYLNALSAVGNIVLTLALVVLYYRQADIQQNQEELMEKNQKANVICAIGKRKHRPALIIRNAGNSAAINISGEFSYFDNDFNWHRSILPDGDELYFYLEGPAHESIDTSGFLSSDEVLDLIDDGYDGQIHYEFTYDDSLESGISKEDVIDLEKNARDLHNRATEHSPNKSIEDLLGDIDRSIRNFSTSNPSVRDQFDY